MLIHWDTNTMRTVLKMNWYSKTNNWEELVYYAMSALNIST